MEIKSSTYFVCELNYMVIVQRICLRIKSPVLGRKQTADAVTRIFAARETLLKSLEGVRFEPRSSWSRDNSANN